MEETTKHDVTDFATIVAGPRILEHVSQLSPHAVACCTWESICLVHTREWTMMREEI